MTNSTHVPFELERCNEVPVCCHRIAGRDVTPEEYQPPLQANKAVAAEMADGGRAGCPEKIIACRRLRTADKTD